MEAIDGKAGIKTFSFYINCKINGINWMIVGARLSFLCCSRYLHLFVSVYMWYIKSGLLGGFVYFLKKLSQLYGNVKHTLLVGFSKANLMLTFFCIRTNIVLSELLCRLNLIQMYSFKADPPYWYVPVVLLHRSLASWILDIVAEFLI